MCGDKEFQLYEILDNFGMTYRVHNHDPVYTIADASRLDVSLEGRLCKNLFLRDRKGKSHYLFVMDENKKVSMKDLAKSAGLTQISFASDERLEKYLNLTPGAVSPFGLIYDLDDHVKVFIDQELSTSDKICFHPNVNTATVSIEYADFLQFLDWCGNAYSHVAMG